MIYKLLKKLRNNVLHQQTFIKFTVKATRAQVFCV